MATTYREYPAPDALKEHIHCCWVYSADEDEPPNVIVPDGRTEIVLHLNQPYKEEGAKTYQPRLLFAGQLTRPLKLIADAPVSMVALRFRPDGARAFLNHSVALATDKRLDLRQEHGDQAIHVIETTSKSTKPEQALIELQTYVRDRIGNRKADPVIRLLVEDILDRRPNNVAADLSTRQIQRRFKREVGVDARTFRAIRRFRAVFDRLTYSLDESWAQTALETGYFDQPQLTRDFRRFLGCTPRDWLRDASGLGKAIADETG